MENTTATELRSKAVIYAEMDKIAKRAPDVRRLFGARKIAYARLKLELARVRLSENPEDRLERESVTIYESELAALLGIISKSNTIILGRQIMERFTTDREAYIQTLAAKIMMGERPQVGDAIECTNNREHGSWIRWTQTVAEIDIADAQRIAIAYERGF